MFCFKPCYRQHVLCIETRIYSFDNFDISVVIYCEMRLSGWCRNLETIQDGTQRTTSLRNARVLLARWS